MNTQVKTAGPISENKDVDRWLRDTGEITAEETRKSYTLILSRYHLVYCIPYLDNPVIELKPPLCETNFQLPELTPPV